MFILLTNKAFFYGFNFSNNHKNEPICPGKDKNVLLKVVDT